MVDCHVQELVAMRELTVTCSFFGYFFHFNVTVMKQRCRCHL